MQYNCFSASNKNVVSFLISFFTWCLERNRQWLHRKTLLQGYTFLAVLGHYSENNLSCMPKKLRHLNTSLNPQNETKIIYSRLHMKKVVSFILFSERNNIPKSIRAFFYMYHSKETTNCHIQFYTLQPGGNENISGLKSYLAW